MIENLSHIQPSEQLCQDLWEYIDRESKSSIFNSSDLDHEHEPESNTMEMKKILYEFPKEIKRRNLNLNLHRKHSSNILKLNRSISIYYRRASSNESIASNSSIETPHERDSSDEQKYQSLFAKLPTPTISNVSSNVSNISNISTSILTNIKIFDCIQDRDKSIESQEPKDIWISINPTDTSTDVIDAVLQYVKSNDINLYSNKTEQYQLKYYSEIEEEICDYLPALQRNDIIASKGVDTIAMTYNINYFEYKIYHTINNIASEFILGIESDRIHVDNQFDYIFNLESMSEISSLYRWINGKILIENNEDCELEIQSCLDISVLSSNNTMFEITFLLECPKKHSSVENDHDGNIVSAQSTKFIQIEDYKPANYDQLWNPKDIMSELRQKNDCYKIRYSTKSAQDCYTIVKQIKHLISSECNLM